MVQPAKHVGYFHYAARGRAKPNGLLGGYCEMNHFAWYMLFWRRYSSTLSLQSSNLNACHGVDANAAFAIRAPHLLQAKYDDFEQSQKKKSEQAKIIDIYWAWIGKSCNLSKGQQYLRESLSILLSTTSNTKRRAKSMFPPFIGPV